MATEIRQPRMYKDYLAEVITKEANLYGGFKKGITFSDKDEKAFKKIKVESDNGFFSKIRNQIAPAGLFDHA